MRLVRRPRRIPWWLRIGLVVVVLGWIAVLATAWYLNPYYEDGTPRRMETHRLLGLPPCTFKVITGMPCPSCGMTTSFALLVRGDVWNSMRANFAGTALCALGLVFVPWALISSWRGRLMWVRSLDLLVFRLAVLFLVLMLTHWGLALALSRYFP